MLSRLDGSSDRRSDFVLVMVDEEVIDIVSFSGVDVDVERAVDMFEYDTNSDIPTFLKNSRGVVFCCFLDSFWNDDKVVGG